MSHLAPGRGVDQSALVIKNPYPNTRVLAAMVRANDKTAVDYVLAMLKQYFGNVSRTTEEMGIGERTLYDWAKANARINRYLEKQRGRRKQRQPPKGHELEEALANARKTQR